MTNTAIPKTQKPLPQGTLSLKILVKTFFEYNQYLSLCVHDAQESPFTTSSQAMPPIRLIPSLHV